MEMKHDRDSCIRLGKRKRLSRTKPSRALGDRHIDQRRTLRQQKPLEARAVIEANATLRISKRPTLSSVRLSAVSR